MDYEICQDAYFSGRFLVHFRGTIIKGFNTLAEAKKEYPTAIVSEEPYDDPG